MQKFDQMFKAGDCNDLRIKNESPTLDCLIRFVFDQGYAYYRR